MGRGDPVSKQHDRSWGARAPCAKYVKNRFENAPITTSNKTFSRKGSILKARCDISTATALIANNMKTRRFQKRARFLRSVSTSSNTEVNTKSHVSGKMSTRSDHAKNAVFQRWHFCSCEDIELQKPILGVGGVLKGKGFKVHNVPMVRASNPTVRDYHDTKKKRFTTSKSFLDMTKN